MNIQGGIFIAVTLLVVSLAGGLQYYRAQAAKAEVEITQLKADVGTLTAANKGLEDAAIRTKKEVEGYIAAVNKMGEVNTGLNAKLQMVRNKMASHKLLKMRNGRHSELLLKTLNKSVARLHKGWMQ